MRDTGYSFKGKPILLQKQVGRPKGGLVARGLEKGIYPDEVKIRAVTLYFATGDIKEVARLTDVPESTLKGWRKTLWFYETLRDVREENNEKMDVFFNDIITLSLQELRDRVKEGDFVFDRKGALVRKPLTAKDLSLVAAINIDKRQLLRGEPTSRSESVSSDDTAMTRMEKLAETFQNLAQHSQTEEVVPTLPQHLDEKVA